MSKGGISTARTGTIGLRDAHRASADDENDFYPTPPWAARAACELVNRLDPASASGLWWEPACGAGHFVHGAKDYCRAIFASDAYVYGDHAVYDFIGGDAPPVEADWIVTNPPFGKALAPFIKLAVQRARRGVALVVRMSTIETIGRYPILYHSDTPLTVLSQFIERVPMHKQRWEPEGTTAAFYTVLIFLKPRLRPRRFMVFFDGRWWPGNIPIEPGAEKRLTRADDAVLFGARAV